MKINFPNCDETMFGADIVFRHKINMNRTSSAEYNFQQSETLSLLLYNTLNAQYSEYLLVTTCLHNTLKAMLIELMVEEAFLPSK